MERYRIDWHVRENAAAEKHEGSMIVKAICPVYAVKQFYDRIKAEYSYSTDDVDAYRIYDTRGRLVDSAG